MTFALVGKLRADEETVYNKAMEKWYRRLAEVPGIDYKPDPAIDRTKLPGHDLVPKIDRYSFDGKTHESMSWPTEDGSTSAAPASTWKTQPQEGENESQTALRQLREALELPGTLSNYHFLIQSGHEELRRFAREEPWVLEEVERLCWLDIQLIDEYPMTITLEPITIDDEEIAKVVAERRGERNFFHVIAFHQLISMYEREGYLREALEVAKLGEKFEQCQGKVEEIEERIRRAEAQANAA
jgi:hypothetical protein